MVYIGSLSAGGQIVVLGPVHQLRGYQTWRGTSNAGLVSSVDSKLDHLWTGSISALHRSPLEIVCQLNAAVPGRGRERETR